MLTREQYEAKRQKRYERLMAAAEKAERESASSLETARNMASVIPFGQPILIGHHSERRDRNYRGRIENKFRRGFELMQKAEEYRSRAGAAANNDAIMSDDPDATDKLAERLAELEKQQALYKAINKAHTAYMKNPASLDKSELDEGTKNMIRNYKPAYSWELHPIAPFQLTNLSANIRRLKERAALVAKKQSMRDEDIEKNGIRIEGRPSENRLRVFYPGRVDMETYKLLKQHGFRPLRSEGEGAFSAYYNNNSYYFVKTHILNKG